MKSPIGVRKVVRRQIWHDAVIKVLQDMNRDADLLLEQSRLIYEAILLHVEELRKAGKLPKTG
jgi:hypothetical protein